jgi:hypothetical protein
MKAWLWGLLAGFLSCSTAIAADATKTSTFGDAITSRHMALDRALAYTGFSKIEQVAESSLTDIAYVVTVYDHNSLIPEAGAIGDRCWLIDLDSVLISDGERSEYRAFKIYLDSASGKLFKIVSTQESYFEKMAEGRIVERHGLEDANTVYVGLPSEPAQASFLQALRAVPFWSPPETDKIIAHFLILEGSTFGVQPVWLIETYGGVMLMPSRPPGIKPRVFPEYQLNYLRTIVDADGNFILSGGHY